MKKSFIFSLFVLGISSIIGQVIIIRELMISFYGNEFFIGWTLFAWLFWVGLGALLFKKLKNSFKALISCHILVALFLPLEIYLIRISKRLLGTPVGEIPNLTPALPYAFLIIAPLCLVLGFQFVTANKTWKSFSKSKLSQLLGKSYFYETIGFIAGGLLFSYFLVFINEFTVSGILAWLNLFAAGFLIFVIKNKLIFFKISIFILLIAFAGIFIWAKDINIETNKLRFPNQELVESKNSIYGNIAVTALSAVKTPLSGVTKTQYNFYESGLLLGADQETIFNEYLVQFPLLYHSNPKKILLVGTGFNGALKEISKHQPDKIYYLELDPLLIKTINKYINLPNTKIINQDARYFLKNSLEKFDVAIINLPNPSTALINRFYSQEFLKEVKTHLAPSGILATHLSSSPNYLNPELENLQASIYKTVKKVFPSLVILPENTNFFIASQNNLNYDPQLLIKRLKQRNIKNNFVTENYIEYRLTNDRVQSIINLLEKNKTAKINKDQRPISYYYNFVYWISYFHSGLAKFLAFLSKINFWWVIGLFILLIILIILKKSEILFLRLQGGVINLKKIGGLKGRPLAASKNSISDFFFPLAMAVAGFSLMAAEVIIIYAFQVSYGYLYYKIGLIITALMIGMSMGTWLGIKKIPRAKISYLLIAHGLIIGFCVLFLLSSKIFISYFILVALIGAIIGFEFPVANKLYLSQIKNTNRKVGTIYGADLLGSCLGASLVSIFILPIFGVFQALILIAILNVLILVSLYLSQ